MNFEGWHWHPVRHCAAIIANLHIRTLKHIVPNTWINKDKHTMIITYIQIYMYTCTIHRPQHVSSCHSHGTRVKTAFPPLPLQFVPPTAPFEIAVFAPEGNLTCGCLCAWFIYCCLLHSISLYRIV